MAAVSRADGVELHWEERGEGPLVVVVPYWNGSPGVLQPFLEEISSDHRVVEYDARGTGRSTRVGPHDMETGAADLEAVIEAAGGPAVAVALGEACNRAVRVAARRPELLTAVLGPAALPAGRKALVGLESMAGSDAVVGAFIDQLEGYYASGLRSVLAAANPQMSEEELRERVARQSEYCPGEVTVARLRAWIEDDPVEFGQAAGERLTLLYAPQTAGAWFPSMEEMIRISRELLPQARVVVVEDGLISRPDQAAAALRELTAGLRAGAADSA